MRTHIDWTIRPPPGTRFSVWANPEKEGPQLVRLDYGPELYFAVPEIPHSRHFIDHADLRIVAEVAHAEEILNALEEWLGNVEESKDETERAQQRTIVAWLDMWIGNYVRGEYLRMRAADRAAKVNGSHVTTENSTKEESK